MKILVLITGFWWRGLGYFPMGGGSNWALTSLPERGVFRKVIFEHQQEKRRRGKACSGHTQWWLWLRQDWVFWSQDRVPNCPGHSIGCQRAWLNTWNGTKKSVQRIRHSVNDSTWLDTHLKVKQRRHVTFSSTDPKHSMISITWPGPLDRHYNGLIFEIVAKQTLIRIVPEIEIKEDILAHNLRSRLHWSGRKLQTLECVHWCKSGPEALHVIDGLVTANKTDN